MLANAIVWQMAVVIHKPLELGKFTMTMLYAMILALLVYLISLITLPKALNFYLPSFALPSLVAGLVYITYTSIKIKSQNIWQ
jgi:hypothetical protein